MKSPFVPEPRFVHYQFPPILLTNMDIDIGKFNQEKGSETTFNDLDGINVD